MTLRYDDLGRPVEGRVAFKSENGVAFSGATFSPGQQPAEEMAIRIEILYQSEKRAVITIYGPDGAIHAQVETNEEQAGREISQVLFDLRAADRETTTQQIDSSDSQGNWTKKTILKRNPRTQAEEPATILHRTIEYY
jgi:hypothetical protein